MNGILRAKPDLWPRLLYILWLYTLLVILWGAWVRISHSGDGCGDHWPLCGGDFIPDLTQKKTWIEYSHRLMSGIYGLVVIFIFIKLRKNSELLVRKFSWILLLLMSTEALLGAVLVKGQLVTQNDSVLRLLTMSLHQLNSFLLTGATFLFYLVLKKPSAQLKIANFYLLLVFALLPLTGAVAALSTTLFPSVSLWQGILQDFTGEPHLFVKLRVLHPLVASMIATVFVFWCYSRNLNRLAFEFLIAMLVGAVTLLTLSPVYLKLAHLLIAHLLWARLLYTLVNLPDSNKR